MSFLIPAANSNTEPTPQRLSSTASEQFDVLGLLEGGTGHLVVGPARRTRTSGTSTPEGRPEAIARPVSTWHRAESTARDAQLYEQATTMDIPDAITRTPLSSLSIDHRVVAWLVALEQAAADEFESLFREKDFTRREQALSLLVNRFRIETLLSAASSQYEERGNDDRLRLASRLVAAAGKESFHGLLTHLRLHPEDTVYFLGAMIAPDLFEIDQQKELVAQATNLGDPDVDEVLSGSIEWMTGELSEHLLHLQSDRR